MSFGNAAINGSGLKPSASTAWVTPPRASEFINRSSIDVCATGKSGFGML
jgi:hypothetical protein